MLILKEKADPKEAMGVSETDKAKAQVAATDEFGGVRWPHLAALRHG